MKKRWLSGILCLCLIFVLIPFFSTNALAADDYPSKYKNMAVGSQYDEWNFAVRHCTSFCAWCLNSRNGVKFTNQYKGAERWGDAKYWGTVAKSLGITVNKSPAVGAIAWWNTGEYGHVAWVAAVNGSKVTIEEYNWHPKDTPRGVYNKRTIDASNPTGYIHIKDLGAEYSQKFYLDLNGWFNGKLYGNFKDWGTCDLTVNDKLVGDDISDHYTQYKDGSTYSISNIKAKEGYCFGGFATGKISGTIDGTTKITLVFFEKKREFHPAAGQYMLYSSVASNRVAAIKDGSTASQANVELAAASTGSAAQTFTITAKDAWYMVKNKKSGLYLDVAKYNRNDGANIWQYQDNGGGQQHWRFLDAGDGTVLIQSRLGHFLEVADGATAAGTNIEANHLKETKSQKWMLVRVDGKCAGGHTWDKGVMTTPACEQTGVKTYTCSVCGSTMTETITPQGHTWGAWKVTQAATETAEGVETRTCSACGASESRSIPMLEPMIPFTDVPASEYYYDAVLWAVNHDPQITQGTSKTTFSPDETCTRGQIVTFLWRAMGCQEPTITQNPFADVSTDAYYYRAVLWAVEQGITKGTGDTTFSPDDPCTRAQVVTFLWRAEGRPKAGNGNPFSDVPSGTYYTDAVLWAVSKGITKGTTPATFGPDDPCTRGQIVTFLYRDMK